MKRALLRVCSSTEGTLVMAHFCNKNILMHVLLCCSPFFSPTFLSFSSFSFLQPRTWIGTASNTYLQSTLQAYLLLYECPVVWPVTPDFKQHVHREITPVQYQLSRLSTIAWMLQYTLPGLTKSSNFVHTSFNWLTGVHCKFWGIIIKTLPWLSK